MRASCFALPPFVRDRADRRRGRTSVHGLDLTGHFLSRRPAETDRARWPDARARLVDRLRRAGGLA